MLGHHALSEYPISAFAIGTEAWRGDALRWYLTGAASDGAAQSSPAASLGNYRSSSLFQMLGVLGGMKYLDIMHAAGQNQAGDGSLESDGEGKLRWTAPGGSTPGSWVNADDGQPVLLEDGSDRGKFLVVCRRGLCPPQGAQVLQLTDVFNNLWDNIVEAESAAGESEYRALMLKNVSPATIKNLYFWIATLGNSKTSNNAQLGGAGSGTIGASAKFHGWPRSGYVRIEQSNGTLREIAYYSSRTSTVLTVPAAGRGLLGTSAAAGAATDVCYPVPGYRIGLEAPSSSAIQTIANENTAPAAISWSTAITQAAGLTLSSLAAAALYGLWIQRAVIAGHAAEGQVRGALRWSFEASS